MSGRPIDTQAGAGFRVDGRFFRAPGGDKHFVKGVTYGPFTVGSHGAPFPEAAVVARDFALMKTA